MKYSNKLGQTCNKNTYFLSFNGTMGFWKSRLHIFKDLLRADIELSFNIICTFEFSSSFMVEFSQDLWTFKVSFRAPIDTEHAKNVEFLIPYIVTQSHNIELIYLFLIYYLRNEEYYLINYVLYYVLKLKRVQRNQKIFYV